MKFKFTVRFKILLLDSMYLLEIIEDTNISKAIIEREIETIRLLQVLIIFFFLFLLFA